MLLLSLQRQPGLSWTNQHLHSSNSFCIIPLLLMPHIFARTTQVLLALPLVAVYSKPHPLIGEVSRANREPLRRLVCVDIVNPLASEVLKGRTKISSMNKLNCVANLINIKRSRSFNSPWST